MSDIKPNCGLCGEPMPDGEEMFVYHGYSGPCPNPVLPKPQGMTPQETKRRADCYPDLIATLKHINSMKRFLKPGERYIANDAECIVAAADAALAKAEAQ